MQKAFQIYKSSAGSGKTYTLVKEYLKIVLQQPLKVNNILAITFTNAAAAEMKSRILDDLAAISNLAKKPDPKAQKFIEDIYNEIICQGQAEKTPSLEELINNAARVLRYILHNYSDFSVSTIDSFVHRIIRTFAFDLDLPLNFEVELDADILLEQAVDLLISRAGHDQDLTRVLVAFIEKQTDDQKDLRIESHINRLARNLLDEEGVVSVEKLSNISLEDFLEIINTIRKQISSFETLVTDLAQQAMNLIGEQDLPEMAFSRGKTGIYNYFLQLSKGLVSTKINPNSYVLTTVNEDKWCGTKASIQQKQAVELIKQSLLDYYNQIQSIREQNQEAYFMCLAVNRNIFPLAVLNETAKVLQEIKDENILLHISDFNKKIAEIVAQQPVPFIYERIGERYQHYMIDEFQDTSSLQWQNLLPLVDNSLATGHSSLVVGDGKQAIYRWRSGDVEQFAALPRVPETIRVEQRAHWEASLIRNHEIKNLGTNYRSRKTIIDFNNEFFELSRQLLNEELRDIYHEVRQHSLESRQGGYVEICFIDDDQQDECSTQELFLQRILQTINRLLEAGHALNHITILCRANREGSLIARYLLENNIKVISSESLLLNQSDEVGFICSVLSLAANNDDRIAAVGVLGYLFRKKIIDPKAGLHHYLEETGLFPCAGKNACHPLLLLEKLIEKNGIKWKFSNVLSKNIYDACEAIIMAFFPNASPPEPFISFFMDVVFNYSEKFNLSVEDFLEWWDKEGGKFSLELPQGLDAVQVMTIHKSKGLQFPVVIYPFAQPSRTRKTKDGQWADINLECVPELSTAWVSLSEAGTMNTPFARLLEIENNRTFLDLLNLIYVAFTRPQDKLFVISSALRRSPSTGMPNPEERSVNGMLHKFLEEKGLWDNDKNIYSIGSFGTIAASAETTQQGRDFFNCYISSQWHSAIRLKSHQSEMGFSSEHLKKGNLMHYIMENIKSRRDIEPVLHSMQINGLIDQQTRKLWLAKLYELLSHPDVKDYFADDIVLKLEAGIYDANGKFYRPDRVVFMKDHTAIIDYKTGERYSSHQEQMEKYANLLKSMGYPLIKKILIYLDQQLVIALAEKEACN
jgi:ATP-dependent exoDNAse (exonuclease V) beta subunit